MAVEPISKSRRAPQAGTARGGARIPWIVALFLLPALTYAGTLANGLVWDDVLHIVDNARIHDWSETLAYFTHQEGLYYRPLVFLGYAIEHSMWGVWPAGFHLTNLALHVIATLLVFGVGTRLGLTVNGAGIAAALFALHPLQVDAVAYVSGRTDLLVAVGALSVWLAVWSSAEVVPRAAIAVVGTVVAALAKESGFALIPFLFWCVLRRRKSLVVVGPALSIACIALAARPGLRELAGAQHWTSTSAPALGRGLATYLRLLVWPAGLQVDRLTLLPTSMAEASIGVLCLLASLLLFAWAATRRGPAADCAVWSVLFYLPVANVLAIYPEVVADWALFTPEHNLYVPLAGVALLVGLGFDAIAGQASRVQVRVVQGALAAVLLACAAGSALRTRDWKDEERIFSSAAAAGSESPRVHFNLGNILLAKGDTGGAAAEYETALRRAPNDAGSWGNLAVARQRRSEYAAALDAYRRALALRPGDAQLHENLGSLQVTVGDLQAARDSFEWALRLDPDRPLSRRALAALHRDEQRRR